MKLRDWLDRADRRLDRIEQQLAEHMRRTAANEQHLDMLQAEFEPIKSHVAAWGGVGKAITVLGGLAGIAAGAAKLLGVL